MRKKTKKIRQIKTCLKIGKKQNGLVEPFFNADFSFYVSKIWLC